MTFNHASYIVGAMDGFTMQQTAFPFVCCILDDASTDGEPEVIRKYLQDYFDLENKAIVRNEETDDYVLCFAQHKTNKNCFFAVLWLKYNHYSIKKAKMPYIAEWLEKAKYIALCEGDDYWIHPEKLMIQANFMEEHNNVCMCTHAFSTATKEGKVLNNIHSLSKDGMLDTGLVIENKQAPHTSSFFYRSKDIYMSPHIFYETGVGDYNRRVYSAINGGIYYFNVIMSHYRKHVENSWTDLMKKNPTDFIKHIDKMIHFANQLDKYTNYDYRKNIEKRINYLQCLKYLKAGNYKKVLSTTYFKSLSIGRKMKILIRNICPSMYYTLMKIFHRAL